MKEIKYYGYTVGARSKPSGLFRFMDESDKFPEYFNKEKGWVEDRNVLLKKMSGEIDESDRLTEEEAMALMEEIKKRNA